jgi:hypothetical protein
METFWAVFFGSFAGLFSVNAIDTVIYEYRANRRQKQVQLLLDSLEDAEFDEYDK